MFFILCLTPLSLARNIQLEVLGKLVNNEFHKGRMKSWWYNLIITQALVWVTRKNHENPQVTQSPDLDFNTPPPPPPDYVAIFLRTSLQVTRLKISYICPVSSTSEHVKFIVTFECLTHRAAMLTAVRGKSFIVWNMMPCTMVDSKVSVEFPASIFGWR
jgi:hypothetical protein